MLFRSKLLVAWNAGTWTYLILMWGLMIFTPKELFSRIAKENDERPSIILGVVALSTLSSLIAMLVILEGNPIKTWQDYSLMISTILGSWLLLGTVYTLHYASMFYQHTGSAPIVFPEQAENFQPDYWDFIYAAFIIGTSAQTADVSFTTRHSRRVALIHSVTSFFFNTTILALTINIAASVI